MFNKPNRKFHRSSVRTHFGMNPMPTGRNPIRKPGFETPGAFPTADGSQLNQPVSGQSNIPGMQENKEFSRSPAAQKAKPATAKKLKNQVKAQGKGTPRVRTATSTKTKRMPKEKPFMYVPRGGRPKDNDEMIFTGRDEVPQGQVFYDGGERVYTSSPRQDKLSNIRTLKQVPDTSSDGAKILGQVRTLFQVIKPHFFYQFGQLAPDNSTANDSTLDDTQTAIYREHYKQMRQIYQTVKSVNNTFNDVFTLENTYVYFYDTFALFAELVCLLQGAAYHLNDATGCDNVLLSAIGNTLNKTEFHTIRNDMARTLRFSYLPDFCIDEAYEMYQTYRVGDGTTSGSIRFVTPKMMKLLISLGMAESESDINTAIATYKTFIDQLSFNVKNGRPAAGATENNHNIPQREWYNVNGESTATNNNYYSENIFADNAGSLTADQRQSIESFLFDISKNCKISMLNRIRRGNSQSLQSLEWSDMWNNMPVLELIGNASYPARIVGGGTANAPRDPAHTENTIYCSETRAESICYKSVQFMLQRFTGYGAILWNLDVSTDNPVSRYMAIQTSAKPELTTEDDILCIFAGDVTDFRNSTPHFIQNNYVTKLFGYYDSSGNTVVQAFNNPDGMSEGQWYLTLGDLRESQYNHGISLLQ